MRLGALRGVVLGLLVAVLALPAGQWNGLAWAQGSQQPKQPQQQDPQQPDYAIAVDVPLVAVETVVVDNQGNFIPDLKREHFRITVNGEPQRITHFESTEAPITVVILMEFSRILYSYYWGGASDNATYWAYIFTNNLKPDDWVALVTFDLRTRIEVDFTRNKQAIVQHLRQLFVPGFTEANLFDAVVEMLDRLEEVKGKKSILLLATGFDTFSKHNLDDALKRVRQTDVTIFSVGLGEQLIERLDAYGAISGAGRVGYLQGKNQLGAFARISGGRAWFPMFDGQIPGIFEEIGAMLRNQYSLAFIPSPKLRNGKYHKIKVELVGDDGKPLQVVDQRGKRVKYQLYAREGFIVPRATTAD